MLAENEPEAFAELAGQLWDLEFETIQYLLIRAYARNGKRFADEAVDYICKKPYSLRTGYVLNGAGPFWATRELLKAVTPYCSKERLGRLEEIVLDYYTDWEKSARGRHARGWAQYILLDSIEVSRRSSSVKRRLGEWSRKFGQVMFEVPKSIKFEAVVSPIPKQAAEKMADEQWLRAVDRYNKEDDRISRNGNMVGGALELSQILEEQAKRDPARFAELACKFSDTTHPYYFDAVLRGITGTDLDVEIVVRLCRRCHSLPNRPCGRRITKPIAGLAKEVLPNEALNIVAWYATEDPDPEQELWCKEAPGGNFYYGGDILTAAINSVRGSAANAVGELIFHDDQRVSYFRPVLEKMVQDPSIAVRSCVAMALIGILKHDRDLAMDLFLLLCETKDALLKTAYIERFLKYALQPHYNSLEKVLERMINSGDTEVVTTGARQACLASLNIEEAQVLAHDCLNGTEAHRLGTSEVFAANLYNARFHERCKKALIQLFNDCDEKVRSEAANCFSRLKREQLGDCVELIEAFVQSQALLTDSFHLLRALEEMTAKLPDVTYLVCERLMEVFKTDLSDLSTGIAAEANTISKLTQLSHL